MPRDDSQRRQEHDGRILFTMRRDSLGLPVHETVQHPSRFKADLFERNFKARQGRLGPLADRLFIGTSDNGNILGNSPPAIAAHLNDHAGGVDMINEEPNRKLKRVEPALQGTSALLPGSVVLTATINGLVEFPLGNLAERGTTGFAYGLLKRASFITRCLKRLVIDNAEVAKTAGQKVFGPKAAAGFAVRKDGRQIPGRRVVPDVDHGKVQSTGTASTLSRNASDHSVIGRRGLAAAWQSMISPLVDDQTPVVPLAGVVVNPRKDARVAFPGLIDPHLNGNAFFSLHCDL